MGLSVRRSSKPTDDDDEQPKAKKPRRAQSQLVPQEDIVSTSGTRRAKGEKIREKELNLCAESSQKILNLAIMSGFLLDRLG